MIPIKIAVGYVRCSTDMQDDSTEQQKKAIEIWAKGNGYAIIEWFEDEGKSGTSFDKRPGFMRMVKRIESSTNFEYVLVYDESRWGRAGNPRGTGRRSRPDGCRRRGVGRRRRPH